MISRRTMLRLAAGAGAASAFGLLDVRAAAAAPQASQIVADEAYWISLAQVPAGRGPASGAIARFRLTAATDWEYVSPYDGTVAARGLLLGGPRYHPMVRAWIEWYLANLEWPDYQGLFGSIHDYWVQPSTGLQRRVIDPLTGQPRYDSTDAYPAVLLSLLRAYAEVVPSAWPWLRGLRYQMDVLANVVIATKHRNGLTGARPDWQGEYLLDNIDAEQGLADYAWLARTVIADDALADYWQDEADALRRAVERELWVADRGMYAWASDQRTPSWDVFYADAVVQSWPIMYGYGSEARRNELWSTFDAGWPRWVTTADNPGTPEQQPWCTIGYAAAVIGDRDATLAFLDGSQRRWADRGRPRPWSANDSAWRALTADAARRSGWSP